MEAITVPVQICLVACPGEYDISTVSVLIYFNTGETERFETKLIDGRET